MIVFGVTVKPITFLTFFLSPTLFSRQYLLCVRFIAIMFQAIKSVMVMRKMMMMIILRTMICHQTSTWGKWSEFSRKYEKERWKNLKIHRRWKVQRSCLCERHKALKALFSDVISCWNFFSNQYLRQIVINPNRARLNWSQDKLCIKI